MDESATSINFTADETRDNLIFVLSVYIPLDLVIITGNALVLFLIRQTRSYDKPQFVLLGSLAFVDLLTGIIAVPMFMWGCILRRSFYLQEFDECELQFLPAKICVSVSWFHLILITVDRYVSIMKPLHYHKHISLHRIYFSIILSWIIAFLFGIMQLFWEMEHIDEGIFFCYKMNESAIEVQRYISLVMVPTGTILVSIMYFKMFIVVKKLEKNIVIIPIRTRNIVRNRYKAAKTSALIVGAFGIAYLPHALRPVVYSFGYQRSEVYWYDLIAEVLFIMSSAVNPFIYVCRLKQFSSALRHLLQINSHKQQQRLVDKDVHPTAQLQITYSSPRKKCDFSSSEMI
ncbi:adenosine receptor A3-like [Antedon mediterranea]|uniref:adenosine receptor A3-like n=1 Tax=Antedon mediterranea TaxID=105859 RepID=UPI003AF959C9